MQYVGVHGNWVVMYDGETSLFQVSPMEKGYTPFAVAKLDEIGGRIEAQERAVFENSRLGGKECMSARLITNQDSQAYAVLTHIMQNGSITSIEAFMAYGITRLSAVIWWLRKKAGYNIVSVSETSVNRYGRVVRYTRYTMGEE